MNSKAMTVSAPIGMILSAPFIGQKYSGRKNKRHINLPMKQR